MASIYKRGKTWTANVFGLKDENVVEKQNQASGQNQKLKVGQMK